MLRARLCDPLGPRWTRSVVPVLGLAFIVGGLFAPADAAMRAATVLAGFALMSWANLLRIPRASRDVTLRFTGNSVDIAHAGALAQRLRPADLRAARVLRGDGPPALALVRHSAPERPLFLELDREEDLDRLRRALGVGHVGFGTIEWPTEVTAADVVRRLGTGLLGAGWIAMAVNAAMEDAAACLAVAIVLVPLTCAALMAWLVAPFPMPRVSLAPHEVTVFDRMGRPEAIPYGDIVSVDIDQAENRLLLETRSGAMAVPTRALKAEERRHLRAQITSAMRRTSGNAEPPPPLGPSLAILAPRDEPKRAWLERLDATAAAQAASCSREAPLSSSSSSSSSSRGAPLPSSSPRHAYRHADLETKDLWDALENPDASASIRAAAARVLARIAPQEGKRIVRVLANERDNQARAAIGAALEEDTEAAARRLESLGSG